MEFLIQTVDQQGWVKGRDRYAWAVATVALAEAYGVAPVKALQEPLVRALNLNAARWAEADGFELVWLTKGFISARTSGLDAPVAATRAIEERLWKRQQADGRFTDNQGRAAPEFAAAYVYSLQLLGGHRDPRLKLSLDWLKQQRLDWQESTAGQACESWHFVAEAMFQAGGKYWQHWHDQVRPVLLDSQQADGRWDPPPKAKTASGPARSSVQATALNCLAFPPYSTKPLYQDLERTPRQPAE